MRKQFVAGRITILLVAVCLLSMLQGCGSNEQDAGIVEEQEFKASEERLDEYEATSDSELQTNVSPYEWEEGYIPPYDKYEYVNLSMVSREVLLNSIVDRMDILEWATKGEVTEEVARMLEEKEYLPEFKEIVEGCGEDEINQLWDRFWNEITQLGPPPNCYYKNDPEVVRSYGERFVAEIPYEDMTKEQLAIEDERLVNLPFSSDEEHELIKSLLAEIRYYRYVKED